MQFSRRTLMVATAWLPVAGFGASLGAPRVRATPPRPDIQPRDAWAAGRAPRGPLEVEPDPRFLLIHHTLTPNTDTPEGVPGRLRGIFAYHTSAEKGWADVAYNFFVDRFGTIWEGREGSSDGPVRGDATGGSQGFAQLCCFLGDFTAEPPPEVAMNAMIRLLAWLAERDGIDLDAEVQFTSLGSTRWKAGVEVTTDAVAAHRDMSLTDCPGDALYPLVRSQLLPDARQLLAPAPSPIPSPSPSPSPSAKPTAQASPSVEAVPDPTPAGVSEDILRGAGAGALAVGLGGVAAATWQGRRSSGDEVGDDDRAADGERGEQAQEESDQGA